MIAHSSAKPWLIVPEAPERVGNHRTTQYDELCVAAHRVAFGLRREGVALGDRVIVVADNSPESCLALLGGLVAGVTLVPVPPRQLGQREEAWQCRVDQIRDQVQPRLSVARASNRKAHERLGRVFTVDELQESSHALTAIDRLGSWTGTAVIQYTSGTTAVPRGVELTHANIIHNILAIGAAFGVRGDDVVMGWLPMFHDMGLIGTFLAATWFGVPLVLSKPASIFLHPAACLWAISRFRVTACAAPNSVYQMLATRVPAHRLEGLDLSSWRVAFNGSEAVHANTVRRFCERFERYGFRARAMFPLYGLAENTLMATCPRYGHLPKIDWVDASALHGGEHAIAAEEHAASAIPMVSMGGTARGLSLRIVGEDGQQKLLDREIGHIEVSGPCVMRGYYRDVNSTRQVMRDDGWLRTGDRGYVSEAELYVVGRSKHVIKRGGSLLDAAHIAGVVQAVSGVHRQGVAVFGAPNGSSGTEDLVVVVESSAGEGERTALQTAIRHELQAQLAIQPDLIAIVGPGEIARTTSGKVQHGVMRERFLTRGSVDSATSDSAE
ncbi:MAG TPA: AMP-binding protein [Polyangiales bacterium]|nr:AMP-binding protein [Polyangiales bacterium]